MTSERATAPAVGSVIAELVGDALLLRTAADDPATLIRLTAALPVEPDRVTVLTAPAVTALPGLFTVLPEILGEHLGGSAAGIRLLCLGTYAEAVAVDHLVRDLADRIGQEIILPLDPCTVDEDGQPATLTGGRKWLSCAPGGTPLPQPEWPPGPPAQPPIATGSGTAPTVSGEAFRRAAATADASVLRRPGIGHLAGSSTLRYLPYGGSSRRRPGPSASLPGPSASVPPAEATPAPAVDSRPPVTVAISDQGIPGRSTPAGWSFLAEDAPTVAMPLAAGFLVEVEIGATGFRVADRPVPSAGLAKLIVAAKHGSGRPVILLSSGTFPGGPAADLLFGGLADALGGPVYVADAAVSVTAHGLLVTEGQFRRWAPRGATPAAGSRHRVVGRVLPVPAGMRRRPVSSTAALPAPSATEVSGAPVPGVSGPGSPEVVGAAVTEPGGSETAAVAESAAHAVEPVPVESVALLDLARWRHTPPALEGQRMSQPPGPIPVAPVPDTATASQAPHPTVALASPAGPVAYTGVARSETQAAARSRPVPDPVAAPTPPTVGAGFGDPGSPALLDPGTPVQLDAPIGYEPSAPYGADQPQPAVAGIAADPVAVAEAVGGPSAPAMAAIEPIADHAGIGTAQPTVPATATPVAPPPPSPEIRPAASTPAPFWLVEQDWDPADRGRLRDALNGRYDAHVRVITRTLAEEPGMRAAGASTEMIAGLVALRAYHDGEREAVNRELRTGGPVADDAGASGSGSGERARLLARGAVHGLRRLPTVLGPVYASALVPPPALAGYRPGLDVVEPAFLDVDLAAGPAPEATVQFVIWSASARRLDRISPGDTAAALFPPGSRFAVLAVDRPDDEQEPIRVLLRDLAGQGVRGDRGVERLLERLRAAHTPATSAKPSRRLEYAPGLDQSGRAYAIPSQLVPSGAAEPQSPAGNSGGNRT
ncbi:hypothetical protein AB0J90_11325 [Micromonospora sp. NPDC049523]|uniref:hypothetical protein n=1 Tax=Micromonospora sp. NPDC049523 TaxID=3155921 RepID=UPI00341BF848